MKFSTSRLVIYLVLIIIVVVQSCQCTDPTKKRDLYKPIRADEYTEGRFQKERYVADEIIIMYKGTPTAESRDSIKTNLINAGIDISALKIKQCNSCGSYIELWQADNIHTTIHGEGISLGTVNGKSEGVGEDDLAQYSLNFIQRLPIDALPDRRRFKFDGSLKTGAGKDTIVIAVLDTGVDTTKLVKSKHLWKNRIEKESNAVDPDANCYVGDDFGWNFIGENSSVYDDNVNLHGTLVTQYIVSEFKSSPNNLVQIMSLKTHDDQGSGDLFSSICALHYAMDKGANIVNASWGFYYYNDSPHPYLDSLVTKVLKQKGILFITAAGNKIDEIDAYAKHVYQEEHGIPFPDSLLRNLEYHNFYPACLSDSLNNVITVTTTDGSAISPTQNYSSLYVDLGVKADTVNTSSMKFVLPFSAPRVYMSGSSFATAIATGKIGSNLPKDQYVPGIEKQAVINKIIDQTGSSVFNDSQALKDGKLIRDGRFTKRE
jgi:hypothetical protein